MRRILLLTLVASAASLSASAQSDDMYFVPTKEVKTTAAKKVVVKETPTYYAGRDCDVDEYNRRHRLKSSYQTITNDSTANDVIDFNSGNGEYSLPTDTIDDITYYEQEPVYEDNDGDYECSRNLGRFYGYYGWYDPFFYGHWYGSYWRSYYGWYDPWFYGWYDPWYYGGWYGWGYPYGYAWTAWRPVHYHHNMGPTGTVNHSRGMFAGVGRRDYKDAISSGKSNSGSFGSRRNSSNSSYSRNRVNSNRSEYTFGGRRNVTNNSTYSRPMTTSPSRSTFGGGSFGGSRGGSFGGGGRVGGGGGGGHFGGRR